MTVMHQQPLAPAPTTQAMLQTQAEAPLVVQATLQPAPVMTGPDVIVEEEVVEIIDDDDNDNEEGWAAVDEESIILSMIQVYKKADAPPPAPKTSVRSVPHQERPVQVSRALTPKC